MSYCICCHHSLLRHIRHSDVYWFCPNCWQEMPDLNTTMNQDVLDTREKEWVPVGDVNALSPL